MSGLVIVLLNPTTPQLPWSDYVYIYTVDIGAGVSSQAIKSQTANVLDNPQIKYIPAYLASSAGVFLCSHCFERKLFGNLNVTTIE